MDNRLSVPGASPVPEPPRRSRRVLRRVLVAALAGGVVAGAVLALLPGEHPVGGPPAPGPRAQARTQALTTVTYGVPAALPGLTGLIGRQEARVRAQPRDARAWAVLGSAYVERGRRAGDAADYPRAERALRTSLEVRGTRNSEALGGLAALALARRDFPAAKRYGEQALKAAPKQWSAYPPLIDAYTGLGDYKNARSTLDKLLGLRTDAAARPAVMARAAAVYRDRGWREDAVAQLTDAAAAARTPAAQAAWLAGVGQLAWERGDLPDALRHFEAALRLDPDQRVAPAGRAAWLAGVGQLAWERGDLPDALRHFEAALRLDPDQRVAPAGRARTLAAMGRTSEALAVYRAAVKERPRPEDLLELGELYESLGRTELAEEQYARLRTAVRGSVAGGVDEELLIGRFEADHGDAWEAVDRLREEWRRQPGIEVADALGWALHRSGEDQEALTYATVATDKAKGGGVRSALYAFHLGVIEGELERYGPARRHLQEALRINPYFSPLRVPVAREALQELGDVPNEPPPSE